MVATGIEPDGTTAAMPSRSFSMSESRAPQRPVLDLPSDSVAEEEPFELSEGLSADPDEYEDEGAGVAGDAISGLGLSAASSDDYDYDDEEEDDVDGIVDPLAGLRNEETERFDNFDEDDGAMPEPAGDASYGDGWTDEGVGTARPPLDLSDPLDDVAGQDELQLGADQMADGESPLASKPSRKQSILGGGAGGGGSDGGAPSQGSTLFERMANLSRGSGSTDDDDGEDDDGGDDEGGSGALNIPRFLGRQNNQ